MERVPSMVNGRRLTANAESMLATAHIRGGRLATRRDEPNPSWATIGRNDAMPIIPSPVTMAPTMVARNNGCRRSSGLTKGCRTRRSTAPNATKDTRASAQSPSRTGPLRRGTCCGVIRRVAFAEGEVLDNQNKTVATASGSLLIFPLETP